MHRLFVALRPPAAMRDALLACMDEIPGARWQDEEQLHLTIRFIGEVNRHIAEDVAAVLGSVAHPPFDLKLEGIGTFARRGQTSAIWANVAPHEPVRQLHKTVSRALLRAGIAPEERAFTPHITLARLPRSAPAPAQLPLASLWRMPVTARFDHFLLYESHLGAAGPSYSVVARYPLT